MSGSKQQFPANEASTPQHAPTYQQQATYNPEREQQF